LQAVGAGDGVGEQVAVAHRGAEPTGFDAGDFLNDRLALRNLAVGAPWTRAPEARLWMAEGVIADFMAAADHLASKLGVGSDFFTDHEENGLGLITIQQIKQAWGIAGVGAVVDGDQDGVGGGFADDGSQRLRIRVEHGLAEKHGDCSTAKQCPWPAELDSNGDGEGVWNQDDEGTPDDARDSNPIHGCLPPQHEFGC